MRYLFLLISFSLFGQDFPQEVSTNGFDYGAFNPPTYLPSPLEEIVTSNSTILKRLAPSDVERYTIRYAKHPVWNADSNTLIILTSNGTTFYNIETDVSTIRDLGFKGYWSRTDADLLYGYTNSNRIFWQHNFQTNTTSAVYDFTNTHSKIEMGLNEGNIDKNDRFVALNCIKLGGGEELIILDIETQSIHSQMDITTSGLDWVSISQNGDHIVFLYNQSGSGSSQGVEVYDNTQGTPSNPRHIYNFTEHSDLAVDSNGEDVLFMIKDGSELGDDGNTYMVMIRLSDGFIKYKNVGSAIYGCHISARGREGWVTISETCCAVGSSNRPANDVYKLKLDYSDDSLMEYWFRAYNNRTFDGSESDAFAVPSQDGTKVAFRSYWYSDVLKEQHPNYAPLWLASYPQQTLSIPTVEQVEIPLSYEYYNLLGQYLGTNKPKAQGVYIEKSFYENKILSKLIIP